MKQLSYASNNSQAASVPEAATLIMEVVPLVMRRIRSEMRTHRLNGLSIPQFRTLVFLSLNKGACLSQVAEYIGTTSATASKMVSALAERQLVIRAVVRGDRRYMSLKLSKAGIAVLLQAREATEAWLTQRIAAISPEDQAKITAALLTLRTAFTKNDSPATEGPMN